MQHARTAGVLVLVAALVACPSEEGLTFDAACTVERIADGDTITCTQGIRIRLVGIDTPELDQAPFGERSRVELEAMLLPGETVQLEYAQQRIDDFGRTLAYLWDGNTMINEAMVRRGWAVVFIIPPNVRYERRLRDAQSEAERLGAGHWANGGFDCRPVEHRHGSC